ncbi:hypothetical protein RFI_29102, partial [Reticulomyxa filosa]
INTHTFTLLHKKSQKKEFLNIFIHIFVICFVCGKVFILHCMTCAKTSKSSIDIQMEKAAGKTKMIEMLQFLVKDFYYDLIGQDIGKLVIGSEMYSSFANEVQPSEYLLTNHVNALHLLITRGVVQFQFEDLVKYDLNVVDAGNQTLKTKPNEPIATQVTPKYIPDYLVRSFANSQNEEDLKGEKEEDMKRQSENDTVEND